MSIKLYKLLKEFKRLGFTKIDTRCKDVYVTENLELRMIDPKGCYTRKMDFPRHLMKRFNKLKVLDEFLYYIEEKDPKLCNYWRSELDKYFKKNKIPYN